MPQAEYIQVIVPVRLDQAFTYRVPEGLRGKVGVGSRVKVRFGPRLTDAVVCATGVTPDIEESRIREMAGLDEGLDPITPEEIRLWQFIADYYLCTQGEVFKCAYPSGKIRSEETAARTRERAEASRQKLLAALQERVARLETEMESVRGRTEEALAALTDRAVKTRQNLLANRDARLARLQEALNAARITLAGAEGRGLQAAGMNPAGEGCLQSPAFRPRKHGTNALSDITHALENRCPVLLQGSSLARHEYYNTLIAETLAQGRTVLMLVPEVAMTEAFEESVRGQFGGKALLFHSRETTARRRKIADALRQSGPQLLIGTRSALFLPFRDLGLVIVDEEQDRSYKQDSPAPRYNARDCAVVLAGIHGAPIVLGSAAPSLESQYNCTVGRYTGVRLPEPSQTPPDGRLRIIDTAAERRKHGMKGQFSIKLTDEIRRTLDQGGPVYLIRLWGDLGPTLEETRALFPEVDVQTLTDDASAVGVAPPGAGCIRVGTLAQTKRLSFAEGSLVALLQADPIFGAQDFRADERAFQLLSRYRERCAAGTFVIQTSRAAHPVFQDLLAGKDPTPALLQERKDFAYPPFTRIIDLRINDPNPKRLALMSDLLAQRLQEVLRPGTGLGGPVRLEGPFDTAENERTLRAVLAKDRRFPGRKKALKQAVDDFIRERKYTGYIHLDVDPE